MGTRQTINLNDSWLFLKNTTDINSDFKKAEKVNVPHNWNSLDGQDGGNDYFRGHCLYKRILDIKPQKNKCVFIEFKGVNASASVYVNKELVGHHDGGYSTFRFDITKYIKDKNEIIVDVDNSINDAIYPQKADFTFYGGIYRDVNLLIVNEKHFDLNYFGGIGVKVDTKVVDKNGVINVKSFVDEKLEVKVEVIDGKKVIATGKNNEDIVIKNVHLWNGKADPFMYNVVVTLLEKGKPVDEVSTNVGFRTFKVDPKEGFFLNGVKYPLRGVCRHQDRKGMGNSLTKKEHDEDIELINEVGANTIRLAHYQHDDYFYDLCDKYGYVVWAEIPYISRHSDVADQNAINQMKELIIQAYHHPSIMFWGTSNEITMFKGHQKQLVELNKKLNDICHELDKTRLTTLACFAMCGQGNAVSKITDVVSWNLYFGWYTPFIWLYPLWYGWYHLTHKNRAVGLSEYGAEAMTYLHSRHPHRGDSTEEYQAKYHEYLLKFFAKRDYLWATHIWNMFDFGSDGRNHGGEPGVNHKGLITFDRKTKKDSFYLYKAFWNNDPFVHVCGSRFVNQTGKNLKIKVYTNLDNVDLFVNDELVETKKGNNKIFKFKIKNVGTTRVEARSGNYRDVVTFNHVKKPDPQYKLHAISNNHSWEK